MGMRFFRSKGGNHRDPRHALEKLYLDGRTKVTHGQISIASILRIFALSMSKSVLNLRVPKSTLEGLKLGASCTTNQNMRPPGPRLPPDLWPNMKSAHGYY